jgi:hypothetical protein
MTNKLRFGRSDSTLSVAQLYLSGVNIRLDDWEETLLLDERPIVVPGNNQFVVLPSEIGLQPPNFFASYPYTGIALYEEYNASNYLATGWSCSLRIPGVTGSTLSGAIYIRSLYDPLDKTIIAPFYISGTEYYSSGVIPETRVSGDCILGWDIYSGLPNAEDLSVSLRGRYHDLYEGNVSQGVIMSSGDAAISFFLEYGAITGEGVLEYYSANQFVATRWGIYSMTTGWGTLNLDPLTPVTPLSGRFYYRDPKDDIKYTIAAFNLSTGSFANWKRFDTPFYVPFRKIVGVDLYNGLNDLRNLNIVLGGRSISSANYFKNVVTQDIFEIFSGGFQTGSYDVFTSGLQNQFDTFSGQITGQYTTFSGQVWAQYSGFENDLTSAFIQLSGQITGNFNTLSGIVTGTLNNYSNNINQISGYVDSFSGQMTGDFYYLSGFLTGLVEAGNSGITSLNNSYGAVDIDGVSGIEISKDGYPSQNITVKYTSGNFNTIDFAPNLDANIPYKEGRIFYSDDTKTFNAYLDKPDVTLNIGQEQYVRGVNKSNSTISNGMAVYISGVQGNRPRIWPAIGSNDFHTSHLIGVATHNILNNEEGLITTFGVVGGINTSAYNAGDILYLSNVLVGNLTKDPVGGKRIKIAYALNSTNDGKILVIKPEEEIDNYTTIRNLTILRYI